VEGLPSDVFPMLLMWLHLWKLLSQKITAGYCSCSCFIVLVVKLKKFN